MKRIFIAIIFYLSTWTLLYSQPAFTLDPSNHISENAPFNTYSNHYIYMKNQTGAELTIGWESIEYDFPEEWLYFVCDYGHCYVGIPENGTMLPIYDTINGYIRLTVNPYEQEGTGTVSFRVFDINSPEQADTISFTVTAIATNLLNHKTLTGITAYPNPARDLIYFQTETGEEINEIQLLNNSGQLISTIEDPDLSSMNIACLSPGLYIILFRKNNYIVTRQKILVQ